MRYINSHWSLAIVLLLCIAGSSLSQSGTDVRDLELAKPIVRELSGGNHHLYSINLAAGQYLKVIVYQRGIDVVVELIGPDGKQLIELDSAGGANVPEPVSFVARNPGVHHIKLRPYERTAASGGYEVKVEDTRAATQQEKMESEATEFFYIGLVHYRQDDQAKALEYYKRAMTLFQTTESGSWVARMQFCIGETLRRQGQYKQALEAFERSSKISEALGDKLAFARTMLDIGYTYELQGTYDAALEYRQKALALGEAIGNKATVAIALGQIGWMNFLRGNWAQALEYYEKSLPLKEALGSSLEIAQTLNQMSLAYRQQGNFAKALEYGQRALTLSEPLDRKGLTGNILISIGLVYASQGDLTKALEAYRRSLTFGEQSGDKTLIANSLEKIASINHIQGNFAEAVEYYSRGLKLNEESGTKRQIIFSLNGIAWVYRAQGRYSEAMKNYQRSLSLSQELGNKFQIANALNGIGIIYFDVGNFPQAFEYFQRSLKLKEEIKNAEGILAAINNIGEVYRAQRDYKQALEYYQRSLSLSEKIGSKGGINETLNNIGETYLAQADYPQALQYLEKSLQLSDQRGDRLTMTTTLNGIASVYIRQGNHFHALQLADRAAKIAAQTSNQNQLWNARTIAGLALRSLNRLTEARQAFDEAISIIESIRINIAGQQGRASYLATAQRPYELYIDLLMQQHKQNPSDGTSALALQLNERARARSLLETLSEARADISLGVDSVLLERERSLKQQLNARAERQMRLLNEKHTDEQASGLQKEIDGLTADYQQVQAEIRQKSPRYAALTQPQPLTLSQIQKDLLDADTAVLEYALGEERSYLWVVTQTSIMSTELPKRSELENTGRRLVALLRDGNGWTTGATVNKEYAGVASELSETLLPAAILLPLKVKRLVIVADGVLQYVPFAALPTIKRTESSRLNQEQTQSNRPLIADYEIISLPSASTLAVLRRETAKRSRGTKSVVVLADPVFNETDERVKAMNRTTAGATNEPRSAAVDNTSNLRSLVLERALRFNDKTETTEAGAEPLRIGRLPFTRFEAEAILAAAPVGQNLKATDFRANRETATSSDLSQYRFVHFATHAILNTENPEISGIVLSLVDEQGKPIDGFLRLHDIYNLNLPADLVVLSACQTGLGKEVRGEGLVGLTRGFMYAGAPRVVASLWKVDDAATAELMKRFYSAMLKDNLRPAAALRRAKIEMWKQKRWEAPFYWAAFELQGEWR